MDIVTQGVLGATMASSVAARAQIRIAAACGFAAGLLADADTLIRSAEDPLVQLEYHRHFTHALAFVPLGALIAAAALWPLLRGRLRFIRLYCYTLLGYALSGVLDACTSYGTRLLWPFDDARIAWNLVSIVDPVFTLALLLPLVLALSGRRAAIARTGLMLGLAYLGVAALQQQRAEQALASLAQARGHQPVRLLVKPTFGNILLWRGLYVARGQVHAAALRAGLDIKVYPGARAELASAPLGTRAARFAELSQGWVVHDPRHPGRLADARYAMLPTALRPLWGVEPDGEGRLQFVTDRRMSPRERRAFMDMLLGREVTRPDMDIPSTHGD